MYMTLYPPGGAAVSTGTFGRRAIARGANASATGNARGFFIYSFIVLNAFGAAVCTLKTRRKASRRILEPQRLAVGARYALGEQLQQPPPARGPTAHCSTCTLGCWRGTLPQCIHACCRQRAHFLRQRESRTVEPLPSFCPL